MKVFVQFLLLSILLGLFSAATFADDQTPAEEDVCADLQLPGVTPGLYGLCNAYCEAQDCDEYGPIEDQPRSCQRLWENFVNKATGPEDPLEPPCLEEEEPGPLVPPCACWPLDEDDNGVPDRLQPENLPLGSLAMAACLSEPGDDFYAIVMSDDSPHTTTFVLSPSNEIADTGACNYLNDYLDDTLDEMTDANGLDLAPGEDFDDCLAGLEFLQQVYGDLFIAPCDFGQD